jgi:diguanylate cyclase (GGDEF)-like protein
MDRVEASRRGVARFFAGTDPAEVVEVVGAAMAVDDERSARILMVDDDPAVLDQMRSVLGSEKLIIDVLEDPTEMWARLAERPPDLVVLDWVMPRISGEELCRALRADTRWADLPILVLTSSTDADTVAAAFAAGADDFVVKPVIGPELTIRIRNRLERSRLLRELAGKDPLTGLPSRKPTHRDLDRMLRHAAAGDRPVCVALVEVDDRSELQRRHGHDVGDRALGHLSRLLTRHFTADEVLGSWETGVFLIGMSDMVRADGVQRVAEALEAIRSEPVLTSEGDRIRVSFSGGVAFYPDDGATVDELVNRAADAVAEAKRHGGDRVLPVGWNAGADPTLIDVALVEDDEVLAELVGSALTTRGLTHRWFADGVEAMEALIPDDSGSPPVQPRAVLMDVGLPGVSGLAVLRRMEQTGALRRTRVIMLTARAAETDVVEALALGAVDHIAKPFSVPVLIERLRRHLA